MAWPGQRPTYAALFTAEVASGVFCDDEQPGPTPINAPSGYSVALTGYTTPAPVLAFANPAAGGVRARPRRAGGGPDAGPHGLHPGILRRRADRPQAGGGAIGSMAIGYMRPTHGQLDQQADAGGLHLGYKEKM